MKAGQVWEEGYEGDAPNATYLVLDYVGPTWRVFILHERSRSLAGRVAYLGEGWFEKPWSRRIA